MCDQDDYFFDRVRIAEEMRRNREKTSGPKPQPPVAAPTAPAAVPNAAVKAKEPVPV